MLHAPTSESERRGEAARTPGPSSPEHPLVPQFAARLRTQTAGVTTFGVPPEAVSFRRRFTGVQQTMGNQAVLRMLNPPQKGMGKSRTPGLQLQRKCACGNSGGECAECLEKRVVAELRVGDAAPPIVEEVLRSPGQPLDVATRAFFELRFNHALDHVRVRTDTRAAEATQSVGALAFTVGRDIVFGAGQYAPDSSRGQSLLAHELVHVLQQGEGSARPLELSNPLGPAEQEAEAYSSAVVRQPPVRAATLPPINGQALAVARQGVESQSDQGRGGGTQCTPGPGVSPGYCSAYLSNSGWLPTAYVNNATCACLSTPNVPTANCVRKFLQDRLAATPFWVKSAAAGAKALEANPATLPEYEAFVQGVLTRRIYADHVDAYRSCCCPYGPAPYYDWIAVTTIPIQPCSLVGWFINHFGSCTGTPGSW